MIKDTITISACKTCDRISMKWIRDLITHEEYIQALNDANRTYMDIIESFEICGQLSEADADDLRLYVTVRFSE